MNDAADLHSDQIVYWNTSGGEKWVAAQEHTDVVLAPISQILLTKARVEAGDVVLDIGCGCGATSLELARMVGPTGRVVAIDVSHQMLDRARARLTAFTNAELICADAASYRFAPFADLAVSRFGVMFFGDPTAAFANLRHALKPGGRLIFTCWRKLDDNPWMQVPLHAVYDAGVPRLPRPGPEAPGPFSFADQARVTRIVEGAGFSAPCFSAVDIMLDIAAGEGLAAAVQQAARIGAASRALQDQPETGRSRAIEKLEMALKAYCEGSSVKLAAGFWLVACTAA